MSSATIERARPGAGELRELEVFHRTLAELCRAEVPLPNAFRLLGTDLRDGELKRTVDTMAREVEQGRSLAEAYTSHGDRLPAEYAGLVEAGLASGDLPGVLEAIAVHAHRRASITERMRRALRYPLVVATFVMAIGALLAIFVAPTLFALPGQMDPVSI
ncbi:MAG: type II secretion system F family protein, partial [Planctomycetota bacterium]|nr:type II secretion system F family protein [Planctomycetota bacterium]